MTTIAVPAGAVTVGVDTHKDIHVAAVLDEVGRLLGSCGFPTDPAARAVLSGRATTVPKARDGQIEAIRALRVARRSCVTGRTVAMNQLKALLVSAPRELREQLRGLSSTQLIKTAARLRPGDDLADPLNGTKYAMREIGLRHQFRTEQLTRLDATCDRWSPRQPRLWWPASPSAPTPPARCSWPWATTPVG